MTMTIAHKEVPITLNMGDELLLPMEDTINIPFRVNLNDDGKVTAIVDPKEVMGALSAKLRSWADEIDAELKGE